MGTAAVEAQTVSLDDAQSKALSFMKKQNQAKAIQGGVPEKLSLAYTSQAGDETYYYVFNSNKGGYVIIGGDEVAHEVLAYSENGSFDYSRIPDNMKWFLSCYDKQISSAITLVKEHKLSSEEIAQSKCRASRKAPKANISYLLQTKWDQVTPFNCMHPFNIEYNLLNVYYDTAMATGCVATAGAQIMKYYEWPITGVGSHTDPNKINGQSFSANFGETTYQWSKMKNEYDYCTYTGDEADIAVGTLMYHIGVAVDMRFGPFASKGSEANAKKFIEALVSYFKYSKGITYRERAFYTDEQWEDMVYDELAAGRPVFYGGVQENGSGHAFVCDGFENGLYHINWGWSGGSNDYFLLTPTETSGSALCPEGSGSGGGKAGEGYYMNQHIGIGITPDYDGTSIPVKSAHTSGYTLSTTIVEPGEDYEVVSGYVLVNESVETLTYSVKVKYVNATDPSDVVISTSTTMFKDVPGGYGAYGNFKVPNSLTIGETYKVIFMYEDNNGDYQDVKMPTSLIVPTITIAEPTGFKLSKDVTITDNGYITEDHGSISFSLKNYSSAPCTKNIVVYLFPYGNGDSLGGWDKAAGQDYAAGEEKDFVLTYADVFMFDGEKMTPGVDYGIALYDADAGVYLTSLTPLYFRADNKIDYTLTSAEWGTLCLPYSADVPDGLKAYKVTGTSGTALVKEEVTKLEMNKPYLVSGTPATYTFHGPATPEASNLKNGILVGSTVPEILYAPANSYVLQNKAEGLAFYKVNSSQAVHQYGAYLQDSGLSTSTFFRFDDEATDIDFVQQKETTSPAYNLNGMRVDSNTRGFVIVNGKLKYNK